jgi:hypothetical protein
MAQTAKQSDNRTNKEKIKVEMEDKNRPGGWERSLRLIPSRFTIDNIIKGLSWVELPSGYSEGRGGLFLKNDRLRTHTPPIVGCEHCLQEWWKKEGNSNGRIDKCLTSNSGEYQNQKKRDSSHKNSPSILKRERRIEISIRLRV